MTLIITELSRFGIAMIADSAVTATEDLPSGRSVTRILSGALKLQAIPYLNAGLSVWGLGVIPTPSGEVSTDIWIMDFIERHSDITTLGGLADALATELQNNVGSIHEPLGFHLAGYVDTEGRSLPTFYHVRNVDGTYQDYQFHEFVLGHDFPPKELRVVRDAARKTWPLRGS